MDATHRWLTPFGVAAIGVVLVANAAGEVGFATTGPGLLVAIGSASFVAAGLTFLLWSAAPQRVVAAALLVLAGGAVVIHHGDPSGPVVGLFLVAAFAPFRLDRTPAIAVTVIAVAAFNIDQALTLPDAAIFIIVTDLGAAFFFLLGTLVRGERDQRARAERLLAELERTRDAERAAAGLAERSRIAREMHDVLAHTLSGLVLQLDGAGLLARSQGADPELRTALDRAHDIARDGLRDARRAISTLRGDTVPGPDQLATLVTEHRRLAGGTCTLTVQGRRQTIDPQAGLALYRTTQEALANIRTHATGAPVHIELTWAADRAVLVVTDDGTGPAPTDHDGAPGYGLTGMAERAQLLGGTFTAGRHGDGFRVEVSIPTGGAP